MIDRRSLATAPAGGVIGPAFAVGAQPNDKIWRVGFVAFAPSRMPSEFDTLITVLPADLAVAQPTKFSVIIDWRAAGAIGSTILQALPLRADEVVE